MEDFLSIADTIQVLFWSLTYVLIIVFSIKHWDELKKEKKFLMPLVAGMGNFVWEVNAIIRSGGLWGHVLWLGLDILIIIFNIYVIHIRYSTKSCIVYAAVTTALAAALYFIFNLVDGGMLISCFIIDLIMALDFVISFKRISVYGKPVIAATKLIGDLFAWLEYSNYHIIIKAIGIAVLALNIIYLVLSILESIKFKKENKFKRKRIRF